MKFIDLDKNAILRGSVLVNNKYYMYELGNPVEITSTKRLHKNNLISGSLAEEVKEDRLMIKYSPTNKIYFSKELLTSSSMENFVSCKIDSESNSIYVGTVGEFGSSSGVLTFSGYLSLNNLVEEDRPILCTDKMKSTVMEKIRVLSLGVRGDRLYGLFYIPDTKGLKLSIRGRHDLGISSSTYKIVSCKNYSSFTIKDWFDMAKVMEK